MSDSTEVAVHVETLKMVDRCDSGDCNAQALVRMTLAFSGIDFCGHHFAKNEAALTKAGFTVAQDVRHTMR